LRYGSHVVPLRLGQDEDVGIFLQISRIKRESGVSTGFGENWTGE
jgi:hypothetical protein